MFTVRNIHTRDDKSAGSSNRCPFVLIIATSHLTPTHLITHHLSLPWSVTSGTVRNTVVRKGVLYVQGGANGSGDL